MSTIILKTTAFCRDFELPLHGKCPPPPQQGGWLGKFEVTAEAKIVMMQKVIDFLEEEVAETAEALQQGDNEEIVDGFGDVAFVALNGIYKHFRCVGKSDPEAYHATVEVMSRICNANQAKRQSDGTILFENNKVQKPEGWVAPCHKNLFE
jgi:hypothetical protein